MNVEDLIEELKRQPWHYTPRILIPGIEVDDFESPIIRVSVDPVTKQVLIESQPQEKPNWRRYR